MNRLIVTVALIAAGYFVVQKLVPAQLKRAQFRQVALEAAVSEGDPCTGKERCLLAYMAPWCPACKALLPKLTRLRDTQWKDSKTRAIKFVVGNGTPEQNREMANQIGKGTYLDDNREFAGKMGVDRFPKLFVLDQTGKVLQTDRDAFDWVNADIRD